MVQQYSKADTAPVVRNLARSIRARRADIHYFIKFNTGGVTTTEASLDLNIVHRKLLQNANDVGPNHRQRLATGCRDTEETLEIYWLREILSLVRALQSISCTGDVCVCLLGHISFSCRVSPRSAGLNAFATSVAK
jgi:hypothetical protein